MMKLITRIKMYSDEGKRTLGEAIAGFMASRTQWPDSLVEYLDALDKKKLTTRLLIRWMAAETGWEFMADDYYADALERLLGRYKNWSHSPANPAGDNTILMSAIAICGIVKGKDGKVITEIEPLLRLLLG